EGLALQVVGQRHRAKHHGHARTLRRLARITAVELIQGHLLMHAASAQAQQASDQQRKWKAQKFHSSHPSGRHQAYRSDTHVDSYGHTATPAPQGHYHPRNMRPTPAFLPGTTLKMPLQADSRFTP